MAGSASSLQDGAAEPTTDSDVTVDADTTSPKWLLFEQAVAAAERELDPSAVVTHNVLVDGEVSGEKRQIDVFAKGRVARAGIDVVIECKRYVRKLGIGKVDELVGKLIDVGAHHGILYAYSGATKPAHARAAGARSPRVEIRELDDAVAQLELEAARRKLAPTSIGFEELVARYARQEGADLAREVSRHLSFNCDAGTGCHGVVDMDPYDDEVPHGTCDVCHTLHLVCECDESLIFVIDNYGSEECYCGAVYDRKFTPDAELFSILLTRHGVACDGAHSVDTPLHPETRSL